jgi:hypothetical protein
MAIISGNKKCWTWLIPKIWGQSGDKSRLQTKIGFARTSQILDIIGAEGQNRTADTGIFSPLLYRLSYLGLGF